MRGSVALALALGLPAELPNRETIITVNFAVAAFSLFVQGLSMPAVLRRMGEAPRPESPVQTPPPAVAAEGE